MKCKYIKEDGKQCRANATNGSDYCFNHNPDYEDEKALAVKRGGQNRKLYGVYGEIVKIETPEDIKSLLAEVINLVKSGKMSASQPANSIAYLSRCWLDAHEASEVEARLSDIENKLEQLKL